MTDQKTYKTGVTPAVTTNFITFEADRVNAIREGKVTQVRRVIAPTADEQYRLNPEAWHSNFNAVFPARVAGWVWWECSEEEAADDAFRLTKAQITKERFALGIMPPYFPEDLLHVKETFAPALTPTGQPDWTKPVKYLADGRGVDWSNWNEWWSPSALPLAHCRLSLRVTAVRPERLNSISDFDAIREGHRDAQDFLETTRNDSRLFHTYDNPWVWVMDFGIINQREMPSRSREAVKS